MAVPHNFRIILDDPELRALLETTIPAIVGEMPRHASDQRCVLGEIHDAKPEAVILDLDWAKCRDRMALIEGLKADSSARQT